jgi:hypothetical protein
MVRLEERPWRASATILLDARARAHLLAPRGLAGVPTPGPEGDEAPPQDSLEWVVEAAASIGASFAHRGALLRVVTESGDLSPDGRAALGGEELLDRLAGVTASRVSSLSGGIERACRVAGDGPLVCLLGAVGAEDVAGLVRARSGPITDVAVLADVGSWADAGVVRGRRSLYTPSRAELGRQRDDAIALLRAAGWRVAVADCGTSVEQVWAELGTAAAVFGVPA